jgi:hypothetical protein
MMLTVKDVATRAGVSLRTAHRVISGAPRSEESREKVEAAMADLGFTPHQKRPKQVFTCTVDGCEKQGPSRVCGMHRERMRRCGTYDPPLGADDAFWALVDETADCWIWGGRINDQGYGVWVRDLNHHYAHRYAYQVLVGPITDDLQLDHTCHTRDPACTEGPSCPHRRCVNPTHLEPVTAAVNIKRAVERRLTCRRGHPWVASNIYVRPDTGHRVCRACARHRQLARR